MTGNKQLNKQLQNYFLNFCLVISILMVGVIIYSKIVWLNNYYPLEIVGNDDLIRRREKWKNLIY
jgi:hypothetical protein